MKNKNIKKIGFFRRKKVLQQNEKSFAKKEKSLAKKQEEVLQKKEINVSGS